jgi:hypothetical protein
MASTVSVPTTKPVSEEDSSSSLSKLFFAYGNSIFVSGNTPEGLRDEDLLNFASQDDPAKVSSDFEVILLEKQRLGAPNAVQAALVTQFYRQVIHAGVFKFINSTLNLAPPILLFFLLSWMNDYANGVARNPTFEGYVWCGALFIAMLTRTVRRGLVDFSVRSFPSEKWNNFFTFSLFPFLTSSTPLSHF